MRIVVEPAKGLWDDDSDEDNDKEEEDEDHSDAVHDDDERFSSLKILVEPSLSTITIFVNYFGIVVVVVGVVASTKRYRL